MLMLLLLLLLLMMMMMMMMTIMSMCIQAANPPKPCLNLCPVGATTAGAVAQQGSIITELNVLQRQCIQAGWCSLAAIDVPCKLMCVVPYYTR